MADEHSDQLQLSPIPAMPEPEMHSYRLIKRYGNISKCHGCEEKFDKKKTSLICLGKRWTDGLR